MKIIYIDESGKNKESPFAVLCGISFDYSRMRKTKDAWLKFIKWLNKQGIKTSEMHTAQFFAGNGLWYKLKDKKRKSIIKAVIKWINDRAHEFCVVSAEKKRFNKAKDNSLIIYKNSLFFSVRYLYQNESKSTAYLFSPIFFMPKIKKNEEDTLSILFSILGFKNEQQEPDWIKDYIVPGQEQIDIQIEKIEGNIEKESVRIGKLREKKEFLRDHLKLLYEGGYPLEDIVMSVLEDLGAKIELPTEDGKEEGWIFYNEYKGVLEIKSTGSDYFNEYGRKQLLEWIDRGRTLKNDKFKGIFIGNSALTNGKKPEEKICPFNENWEKNAKLSEMCVLQSKDLYYIYDSKLNNKLDVNAFWDDLFNTKGIFDIKPYKEV